MNNRHFPTPKGPTPGDWVVSIVGGTLLTVTILTLLWTAFGGFGGKL